MEVYLDSQQTPDKVPNLQTGGLNQSYRTKNTIKRSIPTKQASRNGKPGAVESISCSFLKLLCLSPDLEPHSSTAADLDKIADGDEEPTFNFADISAIAKEQTSAGQKSGPLSQSFSMGGMSTSSRRPMAYLDRVLREWTCDAGVHGLDTLMPASTLTQLNEIFKIRQQELPADTMLNSFTGKIQTCTQLAVRFAEQVTQNIFEHLGKIPTTVKTFLIEIIENTKEGDKGVLSLADCYVVTGFLI